MPGPPTVQTLSEGTEQRGLLDKVQNYEPPRAQRRLVKGKEYKWGDDGQGGYKVSVRQDEKVLEI